ncbi:MULTISPECIES: urease accessory protein UreD [unclassified Acidocella]|uniref:urease accessory protein UreD n=1 Tax=unclassified Acidocella TaxID=2648610 RepID=UPI00028D5AE0|nr:MULTISPECIES: urease accessory protein UreD [unclassified Acidocella]EKN00355.1 urease accessory protein UreD [Acidocella sp. MX-AZ02]WBO59925.1 urease accessory protein UreD [Acidocella sp. MX-AZ03]
MTHISARDALRAAPHQRASGRLDLALTAQNGRTRLRSFYQQGCLKARLLQSGPIPELVAINISGGIASGDAVETHLDLGAGACCIFASQAAERIYRALGEAPARISTRLTLAPDARLFYLPQETILFDGFSLDRHLDIDIAPGATLVGVESLLFGRLAMGEALRSGCLKDRIAITRAGKTLWRDVARLEGDLFAQLDQPGLAGGARAMASLFAIGPDLAAKLPGLRAALPGAGVSLHDDLLLARILAPDAITLRRRVVAALAILSEFGLPRVWQS